MDKSGANYAGLANINLLLILAGFATMIDILQVKYLNNIIEQDHRFIKKITKPMMGFKAFHSAQETIDGIETAHMIRKEQLSEENTQKIERKNLNFRTWIKRLTRRTICFSKIEQMHDIVIGLLINKVEFGRDIHA